MRRRMERNEDDEGGRGMRERGSEEEDGEEG